MVEVIIVVAIIAILASIIMPKMTGARDRSKLSACKANLKHIAIAMEMYMNDNNGQYCVQPGSMYQQDCYNYCIGSTCILVTQGYLKQAPKCPHLSPMIGNQPFYWVGWTPTAKFIYCATDTNHKPHPGLGEDYPRYVYPGGVVEH